jgi:hypothetical protein
MFVYVKGGHNTFKTVSVNGAQLFQPTNPFSISQYLKRIVICSKPNRATFKIAYLHV